MLWVSTVDGALLNLAQCYCVRFNGENAVVAWMPHLLDIAIFQGTEEECRKYLGELKRFANNYVPPAAPSPSITGANDQYADHTPPGHSSPPVTKPREPDPYRNGTGAGGFTVHFGKFAGKTINEIAMTDEGLVWLDWAAGKVQPPARDKIREFVADPTIQAEIEGAIELRRQRRKDSGRYEQ